MKRGNPQKPTKLKSYVCIYVCFNMKAIHLELCSDLSTESFMACFSRFVARHGLPSDVFTDTGTNFIGASNELSNCYRLLESQILKERVSHLSNNKQVSWYFSPASAPHFVGIWEASVGMMKTTLRKILWTQVLTFEEFTTVLTEVESVLNSTPLLPIDSSPTNGVLALTPGHFLIGQPLQALPLKVDRDTLLPLLKR